MSGLLRRLTRRRPATADETGSPPPESFEAAAAPAETPAEPGGVQPVPAESHATEGPATEDGHPPAPWTRTTADEQPTAVIPATGEHAAAGESPALTPAGQAPAPAATQAPTADVPPPPARDLPAGVDPSELEVAPAPSARRGRLRRRLRYLQRVRELMLRDLGGFTYEIHRTAGGTPAETHRRLADTKAARLSALDTEVRELEARLGRSHAEPVLREPGVGGTCPECGEFFSSDAHYCFRCGTPLDARARAEREAAIAAAAQPPAGAQPADPQPASVLWAAGPRPHVQAGAEEKPASMATSEWLARRAEEQPQTIFARPPAESPGVEQAPAAPDEPQAVEASAPATADDAPAPATGDEPATAVNEIPADVDDEPATAMNEMPAGIDDEAAATGNETSAADEEPARAGSEMSAGTDEEPASAGDETPGADDESAPAVGETPAAGDDEPAPAASETPADAEDERAAAVNETSAAAEEAAAIPADDPRAADADSERPDDAPNGRVTPLGSREPRS